MTPVTNGDFSMSLLRSISDLEHELARLEVKRKEAQRALTQLDKDLHLARANLRAARLVKKERKQPDVSAKN
jgi:septal ring factor EnvC (AmiA/AmiB activator)